MGSKLFTLVHIGFLGGFGINALRYDKNPRNRRRAIGLAAAYILVGVFAAGYSFALAYGFGFMGLAQMIPGYALTITAIITLMFTFLKTNGVLFGSRDYDMLMALPIKTTTVITAKFLSMYLNNLILAAVVMISMGAGFCIWNPFHAGTIVMWLLATLLAPLLPMTIAAVVGVIIAAVGSGSRHKVLVQVALTAALVLGIFIISFWVQGEARKDEAALAAMLADLGAAISQAIHNIYPLSAWFDRAITDGSPIYFLLFAGVSVLVYVVFVLICKSCYRRINTALNSHHAALDYKLGELKTSSVYMALVRKEAGRFTSSSVYMINTGMGLLLALMLAVVSIFIGIDTIIESMKLQEISSIKPSLGYLMPVVIALIVNMCNTTSVSLSLEGQKLWVVQSLPITRKTILQGKMLFNILLVLPFSLCCSVIFAFVLRVNVVLALEYLLFSVVSVLFSTVFGMWINLCFPNYHWQNEVEVVKQSLSSMVGILGGMLVYAVLGAAALVLMQMMAGELVLLLISGALGIAACLFYRLCR